MTTLTNPQRVRTSSGNVRTPKIRYHDESDDFHMRCIQSPLFQYLKNDFQASTTHGVAYIVNTEAHWTERVFWLISVGTCVVLIFCLLFPLFARFVQSPIMISVEMDYFNWNMSYPAITLCATHPTDNTILTNLTKEYEKKTGVDLSSYLWSIANCNLDVMDVLDLQTTYKKIVPLIPAKDYAKIAALAFKKFEHQTLTTTTNLPITVEPAMTEMGMCHVINSNVAVFDNPLTWGGDHGLSKYVKQNIELTVNEADFFSQIVSYSNAYKVYIHSPNEVIRINTAAYTHDATGFVMIDVGIMSTRLADDLRNTAVRFRKCRLLTEPISTRYPVYTFNHCMLECRIQTIIRLCGCIPHFYKPLEHERICTLPELVCVYHYKKEILTLSSNPVSQRKQHRADKAAAQCGCLTNCDADIYVKENENYDGSFDINRFRLGINFPRKRFVRDVIFGFYDIVLRCGGVVNLCIGSSFFSVLELIVLVIRYPASRLFGTLHNLLKQYCFQHERICTLPELVCVYHYKKEILTLSSNPVSQRKQHRADKAAAQCGCLTNCDADIYVKENENYDGSFDINRFRLGINFPRKRFVRDVIFGFYDIVLRCGGVVNLCIGSSFFSVLELIVLVIRYPASRLFGTLHNLLKQYCFQHERICTLPELVCVYHYKKEILTLSSNPVSQRKQHRADKAAAQCGCLTNCDADIYVKENENYDGSFDINRFRLGINFPRKRFVRDVIFGFYDIVLRCGGVVNLCIGSSFFSVLELIVLVIRYPASRLFGTLHNLLKQYCFQHERICTLPELVCVYHYKKEILTLSSNPVSQRKQHRADKAAAQCGCLTNCDADIYVKENENYDGSFDINRFRLGINFPRKRFVRDVIFGFYDIVLRCGGVVNLCIGSSFFSVLELIVLVIRYPASRLFGTLHNLLKQYCFRMFSYVKKKCFKTHS